MEWFTRILTLRVYAHALPAEPGDLGFADFEPSASAGGVAIRRYPSLDSEALPEDESAPAASPRRRIGILERETGLEPATLSLGS